MTGGPIYFKSWLPDLPDLDNPGLTEAKNTIPVDGTYRHYSPLGAPAGATLNARPQGAFIRLRPPSSYTDFIGTSTRLYVAGTDKSAGTYNTASSGSWRFAMYDDVTVATNGADFPQYLVDGTTGAFATLGSAPKARHVGVIGQFLVLGHLTTTKTHYVQWSAIDDPFNWPTPGSATAIAAQSGEQELSLFSGGVTGISQGDQFGLIFQEQAITRMTYVGGSTVFQFDDIEAGRGCAFPNSLVRVGQLNYFASADGFYVTDGVSVKPVGKGKFDRYFVANCDLSFRERVYGAADLRNRLIYWGFPTTAATSGRPNRILIYNYEEDRGTWAEQEHEVLTTFGTLMNSFSSAIIGFNTLTNWAWFNGSPGTAILSTGETEFVVGGRTLVQGIKPLASQANLTIALGSRDEQSTTPSYSSEVTANARSGFCDFRRDARYHRARMTIAGTFNSAQGIEYLAVPAGSV